MNPDIITGLVHEHTNVEPMVVQKLDERKTLLVFAEGENIEKLCQTLWSIEIWVGHKVHTGCDVATPEQMMHAYGYNGEKRRKCVSGGCKYAVTGPMPEPQYKDYCPSVTSQVVGKMAKISSFCVDPTQKGDVSFKWWVFGVKSVMESHTEMTLCEAMFCVRGGGT